MTQEIQSRIEKQYLLLTPRTPTWFHRGFKIVIRIANNWEEIYILVLCCKRFALNIEVSESQI